MNGPKYLNDEKEFEEENDSISTYISNQNNDLFDDEAYVPHKLIRVRRVKLPQNGENWEILEDNRVVMTINGVKLTKKEKNVLYTPEGIKLLMDLFKSGNKSLSFLKKKIKEL